METTIVYIGVYAMARPVSRRMEETCGNAAAKHTQGRGVAGAGGSGDHIPIIYMDRKPASAQALNATPFAPKP